MRKIIAIAALAAASAALLAAPATSARERPTPEQRLAKMIEGREAGAPRSCISQYDANDLTVLDGTALVYKSGNTVWVNRPANARQLDADDILVTHTFGNQLCRLDIVRTVDRSGGFMTGFVSLNDFVPYRRVAAAR